MLLLGINTATPTTAIALIKDQEPLFEKSWLSQHDEAEKLLPQIMESLKMAQNALDGVVIVHGPGSFTGLRIGITIANTLAYVQKIPLYPLHTFTFLWERVPTTLQASTVILARAGGNNIALALPHFFSSVGIDMMQTSVFDSNECNDRDLEDHEATGFYRLTFEDLPLFLQKHPEITHLLSDFTDLQFGKITLDSLKKWLKEEDLLPLSEVLKKCLKLIGNKSLSAYDQVKPLYLSPPHITKAKKF